ncbi:molecular chaperone TorD family protein [bacterium]|nr:molecular chaperone TorD family protein [bacterium]
MEGTTRTALVDGTDGERGSTPQAMVTPDELIDAMRARADAYRMFSSILLHELTQAQIDRLREATPSETGPAEIADGLATIRRYLRRAGADPRTDLAVDYARVFLSAGVYDGRTAEPYESAFTSEDHLLYQESRDQVMRVYRENGFAVDPSLHMPEDHLGIEFEFLSRMADRTAEAVDTARSERDGRTSETPRGPAPDAADEADPSETIARLATTQADFVEQHVLNWIDELVDKVDEFAELPLYPAFMRMARQYARDDRDLMRQLATALAE